MARCWETRGCDEAMQATCPHAERADEQCPARCRFAECFLPQHRQTSDPLLVFDPDVDRRRAGREQCTFCEHFLLKGPRL
jgi:hypothetical protein